MRAPFRFLCYRIDTDLFLISAETFEMNLAVCQSEEGVILADADIRTRVDMRAGR